MHISKKLFKLWQFLGFHIIPNRYDEPIPDTRQLEDKLWEIDFDLIGIDWNEDEQLKLLENIKIKYRDEYINFSQKRTNNPYEYYVQNTAFSSVDGEILYGIVRLIKPQIIIEVGSGHSTLLFSKAILKNNNNCKLITIEPYPKNIIKHGFPGLTKLIDKKVQDVDISLFNELNENDIFFIDSSHVLKVGSDVQHIFFNVIPILKKGVFIHIHDIFLPAEYPKKWIKEKYWFGNEQYFLRAFLMFNTVFKIIWAGSYMHLKHPKVLKEVFPSYNEKVNWPGSFWMKRIQ